MTDTPYFGLDMLSVDTLRGICNAGSFVAAAAAVARLPIGRGVFALHQRPVTLLLIIAHCEEGNDDCNPIKIVRQDGTKSGRVLPSENGVEDSPSSATIDFGIAALLIRQRYGFIDSHELGIWSTDVDVPHAFTNIVRAWTGTCLSGISSGERTPLWIG